MEVATLTPSASNSRSTGWSGMHTRAEPGWIVDETHRGPPGGMWAPLAHFMRICGTILAYAMASAGIRSHSCWHPRDHKPAEAARRTSRAGRGAPDEPCGAGRRRARPQIVVHLAERSRMLHVGRRATTPVRLRDGDLTDWRADTNADELAIIMGQRTQNSHLPRSQGISSAKTRPLQDRGDTQGVNSNGDLRGYARIAAWLNSPRESTPLLWPCTVDSRSAPVESCLSACA